MTRRGESPSHVGRARGGEWRGAGPGRSGRGGEARIRSTRPRLLQGSAPQSSPLAASAAALVFSSLLFASLRFSLATARHVQGEGPVRRRRGGARVGALHWRRVAPHAPLRRLPATAAARARRGARAGRGVRHGRGQRAAAGGRLRRDVVRRVRPDAEARAAHALGAPQGAGLRPLGHRGGQLADAARGPARRARPLRRRALPRQLLRAPARAPRARPAGRPAPRHRQLLGLRAPRRRAHRGPPQLRRHPRHRSHAQELLLLQQFRDGHPHVGGVRGRGGGGGGNGLRGGARGRQERGGCARGEPEGEKLLPPHLLPAPPRRLLRAAARRAGARGRPHRLRRLPPHARLHPRPRGRRPRPPRLGGRRRRPRRRRRLPRRPARRLRTRAAEAPLSASCQRGCHIANKTSAQHHRFNSINMVLLYVQNISMNNK